MFGCLIFPYIRPYNDHKLQSQYLPCTFLSYSSSHKGYKCLSSSGKVFISRHVVFDETKFPFQKQVSPSCSTSNRMCILPFPDFTKISTSHIASKPACSMNNGPSLPTQDSSPFVSPSSIRLEVDLDIPHDNSTILSSSNIIADFPIVSDVDGSNG